jgi:hypothetical protein
MVLLSVNFRFRGDFRVGSGVLQDQRADYISRGLTDIYDLLTEFCSSQPHVQVELSSKQNFTYALIALCIFLGAQEIGFFLFSKNLLA